MELMARIEALLRRVPTKSGQGVHQFGSISVDIPRRKVTRDGKPVYLSAREFELLQYFIEHAGEPLSRNRILQDVWGYDAGTFTRTVDVHVSSLRQKVESDAKSPTLILTVPTFGYKFQEKPE
jgi:two-component system alkaline phosphatase synthesis response regulator PhoP